MDAQEPLPIAPIWEPKRRRRSASERVVAFICFIWVIASVIGFSMQAFAAVPTGHKANPQMSPQSWLGSSVWRPGPCDTTENFQTFNFTAAPTVEVGSGKRGDGERLELLHIGMHHVGFIQIESRVCAPIGCNQTLERYKILGANQMQEWHFEGRLPGHAPYVLVSEGAARDGSGPGRVFDRCRD
jgi:hypothetical protein